MQETYVVDTYKNQSFTSGYENFLLESFKEEDEFITFCLYNIFQDETFRGKRILEVGCGLTAHRMATPSLFFSEIILSDYSAHNRENVQRWLKNDSSDDSWELLLGLQTVLEGYSDKREGRNAIKSRLSQKVKKVLPCDVLQEKIIQAEVGKFDVLLTSLCLEAACTSAEIYKNCVKKLSDYILPSGKLVMVISVNCSYYIVNGVKTFSFALSQELIFEALKQAGLKKKHCYLIENYKHYEEYNATHIMVVSAVKHA